MHKTTDISLTPNLKIPTELPEREEMSLEAPSGSGKYVVDKGQSQIWEKSAKLDNPSSKTPTSTLPHSQPSALKTSQFYLKKSNRPPRKTRFAADSISDFPSKETQPTQKPKPWPFHAPKSHSSLPSSGPNYASSLQTSTPSSAPQSYSTTHHRPQAIYSSVPHQRNQSLTTFPSHKNESRPDFYTPLTGNIPSNTPASIPYLSHPPAFVGQLYRPPTNPDVLPHHRPPSGYFHSASTIQPRQTVAEISDLFVAHDPFDVQADAGGKKEKITFDDIDVIPPWAHRAERQFYQNPWPGVQQAQPFGHNYPWFQQGPTNHPSGPSSLGHVFPPTTYQTSPYSTYSSLEPLPISPLPSKTYEHPAGWPSSQGAPATFLHSPIKRRGKEQTLPGSPQISYYFPQKYPVTPGEKTHPLKGETQSEESRADVQLSPETKVSESATILQGSEHVPEIQPPPKESLAIEQPPAQEAEARVEESATINPAGQSDSGAPPPEDVETRHSPGGSPRSSTSLDSGIQENPGEGEPLQAPDPNDQNDDQPPQEPEPNNQDNDQPPQEPDPNGESDDQPSQEPDPNDQDGDQSPPPGLPILKTHVTVIPPQFRFSGPYNQYFPSDPNNLEPHVYPYYYQMETGPIEEPVNVLANPEKRSRFCTTLRNFFRWPFPRSTSHSISEFELPYYNLPPRNQKSPRKFTDTTFGKLIRTTIPHQIYRHFLLRLPSLYFSRVARIFEEAELTLREIKSMALETGLKDKGQVDLHTFESKDVPPQYTKLKSTWEAFIDSVMREWKTFNIISVLLLSAILTVLQIQSAAQNPITRYTALSSLICSLISLLFGCTYIIRFGTMRKTYKAAEWALEARQTKTTVWWNVWVLLAMPAIWLTWSIILYIVCIMSFVWQAGPNTDQSPQQQISARSLLAIRVVMSSVLGLGLLYGALILSTFRRYGQVMDNAWQRRINDWIREKKFGTQSYYDTPIRGFEQWPQIPMYNGGPSSVNLPPDQTQPTSYPSAGSGTPFMNNLSLPPLSPRLHPFPREIRFPDVTSDELLNPLLLPSDLDSFTSAGIGHFSDLKSVTREDPLSSVPKITESEIPEDLEAIASTSSSAAYEDAQSTTQLVSIPLSLPVASGAPASKFTAYDNLYYPKIELASSISGSDGIPSDSLLFSPADDSISLLTTTSTSAINRTGSSPSIPPSKVP